MILWNEQEEYMLQKKFHKGRKDNITEALKTLIRATPLQVKENVIHKWLKY